MDLLRDVRLTVRHLLASPGYAAAAIVTLALAMGATSAIFSAVHAILLSPLPIANPDRLVVAWGAQTAGDNHVIELTYRRVEDIARGTQSLEAVAAFGGSNWSMVREDNGEPVRLAYAGVSAAFFDTMGAQPLIGRTFTKDDDVPNAPRVVMLNHGAWVRRFGANPAIVGSTLMLDDRLHTVVGVMPEGFDFPRGAELWAPVGPVLAASSAQYNTDALANVGVLFVIGRMRDGVTPEAASQELSRLPTTTRRSDTVLVVTPFFDYLLGPVRPALWLLFAAVGVLLIIACANVSALMLTRVAARQREHAVRLALGGTRAALSRLWLLEAIVIAVAGGALGLIASGWIAAAIVALAPDDVPRVGEVAINVPVAAFAFGVISLTTILCGLAPMRQSSRTELMEALKDAARGMTGRPARRTRGALLVFQMGLAVVLLVSAGLVVRSFMNLRQLDLGFEPSRVLTVDVDPRGIATNQNVWLQRLVDQVSALPQVNTAGAIYLRPLALGAIGQGTFMLLDGQPDTAEGVAVNPNLNYQVATAGYFDAMQIRLLRGRLFDARDTPQSERVAIIDDATARRLWPGEDPIGKRVGIPTFKPGERGAVWRRVVGVVADVRYRGLDDQWLDIYDPASQAALPATTLVVRTTTGDPLAAASIVQARARELDPRVVVDGITTMETVVSRAIAPWRLSAWMLALFASLAFLLATVGLFSLISLDVASRRHEFAVRLAVGAVRGDILRAVLTTAGMQVAAGLGLGVVVALAGTRALQSLLFGVAWIDAATYAAVLTVVLVTVAVAAYLPAHRAARIDPLALLRRD